MRQALGCLLVVALATAAILITNHQVAVKQKQQAAYDEVNLPTTLLRSHTAEVVSLQSMHETLPQLLSLAHVIQLKKLASSRNANSTDVNPEMGESQAAQHEAQESVQRH